MSSWSRAPPSSASEPELPPGEAVLEPVRRAGAAVEPEMDRAGVDRIALQLGGVARLEQGLVDRVVAPAEEDRADEADVLSGKNPSWIVVAVPGRLRAIGRGVRADPAEHRVGEPRARQRRALERVPRPLRRAHEAAIGPRRGLRIDPGERQHRLAAVAAEQVDRVHRMELRVAIEPRALDRRRGDQDHRRRDDDRDRLGLAVAAPAAEPVPAAAVRVPAAGAAAEPAAVIGDRRLVVAPALGAGDVDPREDDELGLIRDRLLGGRRPRRGAAGSRGRACRAGPAAPARAARARPAGSRTRSSRNRSRPERPSGPAASGASGGLLQNPCATTRGRTVGSARGTGRPLGGGRGLRSRGRPHAGDRSVLLVERLDPRGLHRPDAAPRVVLVSR